LCNFGDILLSPPPVSKRKQIAGARRALGFFAVVWFNLALQPCAIALEEECPRCPPEMDHSGMSHHGDSRDSANSETPCATSSSDCTLLDDYSHDRGGYAKLKDAPNNASVAVVDTNLVPSNVSRTMSQGVKRHTFAAPGAAPPLNVLYCVYLK
jgi:hypothetical protein